MLRKCLFGQTPVRMEVDGVRNMSPAVGAASARVDKDRASVEQYPGSRCLDLHRALDVEGSRAPAYQIAEVDIRGLCGRAFGNTRLAQSLDKLS